MYLENSIKTGNKIAFAECRYLSEIINTKELECDCECDNCNCNNSFDYKFQSEQAEYREGFIHLYRVKEIGEAAFLYCSELRGINMPKVEEIGKGAFENCNWLYEINMPRVEEIGESAFKDCHALHIVNKYYEAKIGKDAFDCCDCIYEYAPIIIVTYYMNDGTSNFYEEEIEEGGTVIEIPTPGRLGYEFIGWYLDPECTQYVDSYEIVYEGMILYAGWKKIEIEETKPEETLPEETKPSDENKPSESKPEESSPSESESEETKPSKPEETKPGGSEIEETKPSESDKEDSTSCKCNCDKCKNNKLKLRT